MPIKKGDKKTGGRKKGTPNKTPKMRQLVEEVLTDLGGKKYVTEFAKKYPQDFMKLAGKLIPTKLEGDPDNPLIPKKIEIEFVENKSKVSK